MKLIPSLNVFRLMTILCLLTGFLSCNEQKNGANIGDDVELFELESLWLRLGDHKGINTQQDPLASMLAAEISPDMKYVLSSSRGGNDIVLWHTESGESAWEIILDQPTRVVKFSPDSKYILAGGDYKSVKIWQIPEGVLIKELSLDGSVETIEFTSDGNILATGDRSGKITLWNTDTWQIISSAVHDFRPFDRTPARNDVNVVAFTIDDKFIISGGLDRKIKKWSVPDLILVDSVVDGLGSLKAIKPFQDGKYFATSTGDPDYSIRLWEVNNLTPIDSLKLDFVVETIDLSRKNDFVFAGLSISYHFPDSVTDFIQIFRIDYTNGKPALVYNQGVESIRTKYLHFSPDGKKLVSAHTNGILQLWNVKQK